MARELAKLVVTCLAAGAVWACSASGVQTSPGDDGGTDGLATGADTGVIEKGRCIEQPDGTPCGDGPNGGATDCRDAPTCASGACVTHPKPDGTMCGRTDPCTTGCIDGVCVTIPARADGYNWKPGDYNARCCAGAAVNTTTNDNCGACTIKCNPSNGESCATVGKEGRYYCVGCNSCTGCGNIGCWSHCCSLSFTAAGACAASDCTQGLCVNNYCPPNTTCMTANDSSDYCGYSP